MVTMISADVQIPNTSPTLIPSPLQFLLLSVRSKRAAGPICSLQHCTCSVRSAWYRGDTESIPVQGGKKNYKKASDLGTEMRGGSGEKKTEQIKVK